MVLIYLKKDMNEIKKNDKQKYQCERKKLKCGGTQVMPATFTRPRQETRVSGLF